MVVKIVEIKSTLRLKMYQKQLKNYHRVPQRSTENHREGKFGMEVN
jgi:hypothetical protein